MAREGVQARLAALKDARSLQRCHQMGPTRPPVPKSSVRACAAAEIDSCRCGPLPSQELGQAARNRHPCPARARRPILAAREAQLTLASQRLTRLQRAAKPVHTIGLRVRPWLPLADLEHLASSVDHRRRTKLDPQRRLGAMASPRPQPSAARPARGQPRPWVPPPGLAPGRGAAF
jgi:hypothetical protein